VCVIGIGKIGLPLAVFLSRKYNVIGFDINSDLIMKLNQKVDVLPNEPGVFSQMQQSMEKNNLKFTSNLKEFDTPGVYIITVPLALKDNYEPDFSNIDQSIIAISRNLRRGDLVIVETTMPVGSLRNHIQKEIETYTNMKSGKDFYLAYSPERVQSGTFFRDLVKHPKIVGALDDLSRDAAAQFYKEGLSDIGCEVDVIKMANSETAEMTKLAECVYRDVNIALANEFERFASQNGINIHEVINGANSQYQSNIHKPGISVGGHCIPVYPHLLFSSGTELPLISFAREINRKRPEGALDLILSRFGSIDGKKILVLGICYRSGVRELANSGGIELANLIQQRFGVAEIMDPLFTSAEISDLGFTPGKYGSMYDAVILVTEHSDYLDKINILGSMTKLIIDGRNFFQDVEFQECEIIKYG
jgi:UDP-N-acetyl-D-glucosamine dehydrogenase